MAFAIRTEAGWQEIAGPFTVGDMRYPADWPALAAPQDRAALGIVQIVEPAPAAEDVIVTGSTLTGDIAPTRTWTIEPLAMADLKARCSAKAEAIRDAHLNGTCATPSGDLDCDPQSRLNIAGSVQMAQLLGDAFSISWRRADNSYVTLDAAAMTAVGIAVGQHVAACYAAGFAAKDAIAAAETREAVLAVDLLAKYPG